jgi:hypothetical protein
MRQAQIFKIKINETPSGLIIAESDEDAGFFVATSSKTSMTLSIAHAIEANFKLNHKKNFEALPVISEDEISKTWVLIPKELINAEYSQAQSLAA